MSTTSAPTILTGLRANSEFTLGNFLGALLPMVRLANTHSGANAQKNAHSDTNDAKTHNEDQAETVTQPSEVNIFVPDLHSIIAEVDGELQQNLIKSLKYYLAAGLELTPHVHLYRQSRVPAHSELCWILNCVASMGELNRMTQYKDKSEGKDSVNVGIFDYPVLMAADILLYDAVYVPVGEDQFQHLELARRLAQRFNNRFGEIFTPPAEPKDQIKFMNLSEGIRIRDLQNPEKKMSKSAASENSKIMLSDNPTAIKKKIMSATTDSVGKIQFDMFNQPGISNLLQIESIVTGLPLQDVISTWAGETHYGDLKQKVAESVSTFLAAFQEKLAEIPDSAVLDLLETGETYANKVANAKLYEVQKAFHLR